MLGKKFLILAMVLIAMVGTANAAISLTVNEPTASQLFLQNIGQVSFIDFNVTVVDSVATNSVHEMSIQYAIGDSNVFVNGDSNTSKPGTDVNLSNEQCSFATTEVWTTPGADCIIRYTLPTGTGQIPTGTYVFDINATGYNAVGNFESSKTVLRTISFDNRWINAATEALMLVIPVVLIAAVLVGIVLVGFGAISGKTLLIIVVGAVVSIIAIMVYSTILGVLTP